jgi:hypothetical protein
MKLFRCLLGAAAFCVLTLPSLPAQEPLPSREDEFAGRLSAYADTAARELRTTREEVVAALKTGDLNIRQRYAVVLDNLDRCDEALGELKLANYVEFAPRKASFETARAALMQALQVARQTDQLSQRRES